MDKSDYRRELEQFRKDNIKAITIDLRPYASLFFIEQQHFLLPASGGFYLKGSATPLLYSSISYKDIDNNNIDISELFDYPKDVYYLGKKVADFSLFNKKNFWLSENDLKYISSIKFIAKHIVSYFKARTYLTIGNENLKFNEVLNEGGLMCYDDNTLSEYFIKLEHQLEEFINKDYYNTYKLDLTSNSLSIIKDIDIRIEEWYQNKMKDMG